MAGSTALDTSVLLAAFQSWHTAHSRCFSAVTSLLEKGDGLVIPLHALLECYSVMTRLPAPHRLSPRDALALLSDSFEGSAEIPSLSGEEGWSLLAELAPAAMAGGITYDAAILASARKAQAKTLLTLNLRHFERLPSKGIEIRVP
jgi:predicted nucleic acid-binding protein